MIHMMNPHALRVGNSLYWRTKHMREKHGDPVTVTHIKRGKYSGDTMVHLLTYNGTVLEWYLSDVRYYLSRVH